jgi:serine phosphatase RsbU (regulator of sigma subunit)
MSHWNVNTVIFKILHYIPNVIDGVGQGPEPGMHMLAPQVALKEIQGVIVPSDVLDRRDAGLRRFCGRSHFYKP